MTLSRIRIPLAAPCLLIAALAGPASAGPGAHGPNGEHLDAPPAAGAATAAAAAPRLEAKSELFELVATLSGGELSILIDRYETNEPVLQARVEVEADGHQATAKFHADHGDYAIDDAAFLKTLSKPGDHALVFTVIAGDDSDLLDGTLRVAAHDAPPAVPSGPAVIGSLGLLAGLGALGGAAFWWRRRIVAHRKGVEARA